jgi:hypothetical protein
MDGCDGALAALEAELTDRGAIGAADVLALRRAVYRDGKIGPAEAACLLRLNRACAAKEPAFEEFFVEALTDRYVWSRGRRGLDEAEARELIEALGGAVCGLCDATELRLLLKIIAETDGCPDELRAFALKAARHSVLYGDRALFGKGPRRPGVIDAAGVEIIRRIVHGTGGEDGLAVSRTEAELLFDLDRATAAAPNAPAWRDLFVKAITMHLLFGGGSPERVDEPEARWLIDRIGGDDRPDGNAAALLRYLRREARSLHPLLTPLLQRFGLERADARAAG